MSLPYSPSRMDLFPSPDLANKTDVEILAELTSMSINEITVFMKQHLKAKRLMNVSSKALRLAFDEPNEDESTTLSQSRLVILEVLSHYPDCELIKSELIPCLTQIYDGGSKLMLSENEVNDVINWLQDNPSARVRESAIELAMQYASLGVLSVDEQTLLCNALLRVLCDAGIRGLTCAIAAIEYLLLSEDVAIGVVDNIKLIFTVISDNKLAVSHLEKDESFLKSYCTLLVQAIFNDDFRSVLLSTDPGDAASFLCSMLQIELKIAQQARNSRHVVAALACAAVCVQRQPSQQSVSPIMLIPGGKGTFSSTVSKTLASMTSSRRKLLSLSQTARSVLRSGGDNKSEKTDLNSTTCTDKGNGEHVLDVIRDALDSEEQLLSACSDSGMEDILLELAATPGVTPSVAEICLSLMMRFRPPADQSEGQTGSVTSPSWSSQSISQLVDAMSLSHCHTGVVSAAAACLYSVLGGNDQNWIHIFKSNSKIVSVLLNILGTTVQENTLTACLQGLLVIASSSNDGQEKVLSIQPPGGISNIIKRITMPGSSEANIRKCLSVLTAAITAASLNGRNIATLVQHGVINYLQTHLADYADNLNLLSVILCHADHTVTEIASDHFDMSLALRHLHPPYPSQQFLKVYLIAIAQVMLVNLSLAEVALKNGILDKTIQIVSERATGHSSDIETEYCCGYLFAVLVKQGDEQTVRQAAIAGAADLLSSTAKFQSALISSDKRLLCTEMLELVEKAHPARVDEIAALNEKIASQTAKLEAFESEKRILEISYLEKIEKLETDEKALTTEKKRLSTVEVTLKESTTEQAETIAKLSAQISELKSGKQSATETATEAVPEDQAETLEKLTATIAEMQSEKEQLLSTQATLKEEISSQKASIDTLNEKLTTQLTSFEVEKQALEATYLEKLQKHEAEVPANITSPKPDEVTSDYTDFQSYEEEPPTDSTSQKHQPSQQDESINPLTSENTALKEEIASLHKLLEGAKANNKTNEELEATLTATINQLQSENNTIKKELAEEANKKLAETERLQQLKETTDVEQATTKKQYDQQISTLTATITQSEEQTTILNQRIKSLESSLDTLNNIKRAEEEEHHLKQTEIVESFEQRIAALELANNHLDRKATEVQSENLELRKASEKLAEIQSSMNQMNSEVRSAVSRAREAESAYQQLKEKQSADCIECDKLKGRLKASFNVISKQTAELQQNAAAQAALQQTVPAERVDDIVAEAAESSLAKRSEQLKKDEDEISKIKQHLKTREKRIRKVEKQVRARDSGWQPATVELTSISPSSIPTESSRLTQRIAAIKSQEVALTKAHEELAARENRLRQQEDNLRRPIRAADQPSPEISFPTMIDSYRTKKLEKEVQRMISQIVEFNKTRQRQDKLSLKQQKDYDLLVVIRNCPLGNKAEGGHMDVHQLLTELRQWWTALKTAWLPHYEQYLQERCSELHDALVHVAEVLQTDVAPNGRLFSTPTPPANQKHAMYLEKLRPTTTGGRRKRATKQAFASPTYSV
eukprot:TRINITY_DN16460_c0_g1_i2.p1 TRINITY_DN16460_c0_g1~~TRINITY_DN16460_c0_g1_i2.p1  ORF type:complete len:1517 (+),score=396.39 TRINITY_DN16460_c0_g1_i2:197-4747(+)